MVVLTFCCPTSHINVHVCCLVGLLWCSVLVITITYNIGNHWRVRDKDFKSHIPNFCLWPTKSKKIVMSSLPMAVLRVLDKIVIRFIRSSFHLSINPLIHDSIHESICPSIHPSIHPSMRWYELTYWLLNRVEWLPEVNACSSNPKPEGKWKQAESGPAREGGWKEKR